MMGYRDPNDNIEEQEAEYWDMVLHDFGVATYVKERYEDAKACDCSDECPVLDNPWFKHSHSNPS